MQQKRLNRSLLENLRILKSIFGDSGDFYTKEIMISGVSCAIVMFTGLSSPEKLCHLALEMLDHDLLMLNGSDDLVRLSAYPKYGSRGTGSRGRLDFFCGTAVQRNDAASD
ncbi:hypothetical protein [Subdoligranulum variabile]|uniref:hypothetical protein n=1 Tax=Subdoligranulum variabile TaxID=214851 RepID=UPI0001967012|nr:hypothetical protein [Subdoligranulum variabile]UWP68198.1 hypothetical protein NQ490_14930 [Subdoligranulum variabile]